MEVSKGDAKVDEALKIVGLGGRGFDQFEVKASTATGTADKSLTKREWDRFMELASNENCGYARMTVSGSKSGDDHMGRYSSDYESMSVEVAMKDAPAPPAAKGVTRRKIALKDAVKTGDDLVFAWALVSREKNADGEWVTHKDRDGDTMTDATLIDAFKDTFGQSIPFYKNHDMDDRTVRGAVQFMALTEDVQKGLGMDGDVCGLGACIKVTDPGLLDEIVDGKLPDVSIEAFVAT